jgi:hypothetical protein
MDFSHIFGAYFFPILLIIGACYLALKEWAVFHTGQKKNIMERNPKSRFFRREISSLLVIIVGIMLHYGMTRLPSPTQDMYTLQLAYWTAVVCLVFSIFVLALWDAYSGVRTLEKSMDHSTEKYVKQIRESMKK